MEEFDAMDATEQVGAIVGGNFLADREENGLIVQLYSLGKIYGELFYDPAANKVLRHRAFEDIGGLVPYLSQIKFDPK